jgi:hypothetical protein
MNTRQTQTLELVTRNSGLTSGELGTLFAHTFSSVAPNVGVETPHKRLVELERQELVSRGPSRKCRLSGRQAATWNVTGEGVLTGIANILGVSR